MWIEVENRINEGDYVQYGDTIIRIYNKNGKEVYIEVRTWQCYPMSKHVQIIAYRGEQYIDYDTIEDAIRIAYYCREGSAYFQI